ncbi:DUF1996 domain-containing protein [Streptomyces cinereospinus]|uniref:DUF1996 domain-containing protein n=1 Tax=Streptomyces cinereospinus TaxID=285561 RepID=A0ABV5N119_9ACTN
MLGGGGLVGVNVYASATDGGAGGDVGDTTSAWGVATVDCPDVGERLTVVPDAARTAVDQELALLDQQVADAYRQLREQSAGSAEEAVLAPLTERRAATIERVAVALDNAGERPEGLEALAACTLRAAGEQAGDGGDGQESDGQGGAGQGSDGQGGAGQGSAGQGSDGQGGIGGQAGNGPVAADYADITGVQPDVTAPQQTDGASRGTFTTSCGVNAGGLFNSDNVIVAPGVTNGAHHFHDYVGNQASNAFASDEDLAAADTSCADPGDRSSYYWPVLRLQNGTQEQDAQAPGGGIEGNAGEIVTPEEVTLTFGGNPRGEVTAMPRLLRIITGDAKAFVNGPANANASWSCTGFEDRQLTDKYPLCPPGSDVVRTFRFQSCWDGSNIDSANHRTHVAFADPTGGCPSGFRPIPQLVQRIVYDVDAPSLEDGGRTTPLFAVDSFPEQLHKPVTDHGDFINVFDEDLMAEMVDCINGGRQCAAGSGNEDGAGGGDGGDGGEQPQPGEPGDDGEEQPGEPGNNVEEQPGEPGDGGAGAEPTEAPGSEVPGGEAPAGDAPGDDARGGEALGDAAPDEAAPGDETPGSDASDAAQDDAAVTTAPRPVAPKAAGTPTAPSPAATTRAPAAEAGTGGSGTGGSGTGGPAGQQATAPQASQGGLAETGTRLWPAAAGSALLVAGGLLLVRTRRRQV